MAPQLHRTSWRHMVALSKLDEGTSLTITWLMMQNSSVLAISRAKHSHPADLISPNKLIRNLPLILVLNLVAVPKTNLEPWRQLAVLNLLLV